MEFLGIGLPELLLIVLVLLLLFGASKLPELGRSIGTFTKEIKKGMTDEDEGSDKNSKGSKSSKKKS